MEAKSRMTQKKQIEIFKRFYAGIYSRRDEKELLETDAVNSMMEAQWENPGEIKDKVKAPDFDALFSRIDEHTAAKPKLRRFPAYRMVAGIAILAGLTAALYFIFQNKKTVEKLQFTTTTGEVKSFTLPDGSSLWLGENSRVSFPAEFEGGRNIDLEGLAFFKVVKNNTPFRVNAGLLSVEVTGTEFSVSNYSGNPEAEVTLVEGAVNITDSKGVFIKKLKPNEKFSFNKATGSFQILNVNARELTLWKEANLVFNNTPLNEIATQLGNRYDVNIRVDKNAEAYNFTFSLSNETLDQALTLINALAPVEVKQINDTLIFSLKK